MFQMIWLVEQDESYQTCQNKASKALFRLGAGSRFPGTGTGLNRILSVPTFFPHASLQYSKQNGGRLIDEEEHDCSLGTKESEQRPF